jgi:transposase
VIFLDESGALTNLVGAYGRSLRGTRQVGFAPQGHWKVMTAVAAVRLDGLTAPFTIDCPMDGEIFNVYVEQVLAATLRGGDVVVMDNLSAHKRPQFKHAVEAAGAALLYLPPYSPDFNPIEFAFAKLKALLRSAAARTVSDLWEVIRQAFVCFSPDECRNYFAAAGYEDDAYAST